MPSRLFMTSKPFSISDNLNLWVTRGIRTMVTAEHKKEDLDFAIGKFEKVGKEVGLIG